MNTTTKTLSALAGLALIAGSAQAAPVTTIAGDGVASFSLRNAATGDITSNPNGLEITGQVGAWALITTGSPSATDDGVTLTFTPSDWGNTTGDDRGNGNTGAIRLGSFLANEADIPWTITGLSPNSFYDMIWYNKRVSPGENRHPNSGVTGFDAGSGIGVTGPLDADRDQNFVSVQADGTGAISGRWFLAGGLVDITAVSAVQITDTSVIIPEPATGLMALVGLGVMAMRRRRA